MKLLRNIMGVAAIAVTFSSCLKDKNIDNQEYGMINYDKGKIVELPAPPNHFHFKALELRPQDTTFAIVVAGLATDQPVSQDVKLTLSLANSQAIIDAYNTANGTSFIQLDPAMYQLQGSGLTVTIPAGSRYGNVMAKLNPTNLDPALSYGLGFTITSVETAGYTVSGNFGKVLVGIGVKNKYDGIYEATGTFVDYSNPLFTYYGPQEYWLETQNATQVLVWNETLGTYGYLFLNAGAGTYYGSFGLLVTFDPATDKIVSVVNAYGQPSSNGRSAELDPSGINAMDANHDIDIKYWMNQPSVFSPHRSAFNEHWDYKGPRP